nr:14526_t:CDS:2 [Entrophospora candida]
MSFVLDLHDPNGKLYKIHQEHFGQINKNQKLQNKENYGPSVDEGMWTKLTIDAFIYSMLKFFDRNLVVCWGDSANQTTKGADVALGYDTEVIKSYTKNSTKTPTFNYGKMPDISVYWSNEHFHTTVCLMEASSGPFAAPDMLKKEGDW